MANFDVLLKDKSDTELLDQMILLIFDALHGDLKPGVINLLEDIAEDKITVDLKPLERAGLFGVIEMLYAIEEHRSFAKESENKNESVSDD